MKKQTRNPGVHIGFCGIDGAGKSTQAILLCRWLKNIGLNAIVYEERRNFVSEITDSIAKEKGIASGRAYFGEQLYMTCISFEVLRQNMLKIRPFTDRGITIVSSRTVFDWLAGAITRGCRQPEFNFIKEVILFRGTPDLTLWIDTSPDIARERVANRKFDEVKLNYLIKNRESFEVLLREYPHQKIQGDGDIGTVQDEVIKAVKKFLQQIQKVVKE